MTDDLAQQRLLAADAATVALTPDELDPPAFDAGDVPEGAPTTASLALSSLPSSPGDVEIGLWEITPGTVGDVEADEVFVVLDGQGILSFDDGSTIALAAGTIVRLRAGDRTTWTITETLRKVYLTL